LTSFRDRRLRSILDTLVRIARGDLAARVEPSDRDDETEAILAGINMMAEELEATIQELNRSKMEIRELGARRVKIEEEERKHVSKELHDQVGQTMGVLNLKLHYLAQNVQMDAVTKTQIGRELGSIVGIVEGLSQDIRGVISKLRPAILDDYGFLDALSWHVNQFAKNTGIKVEILGDPEFGCMPEDLETGLFRITQEAMNNILKHAQASRILITPEKRELLFSMTIEDNGKGFEENSLQSKGNRKGWGLAIMKERAFALGGALSVVSVPGKGTKIHISVETK